MSSSNVLFAVHQATLPIRNSSKSFPIRRVYCIGRNYREHAIEMGCIPADKNQNKDKEEPFHFSKPASAVTTVPQVPYPTRTNNLHYEAELVIAIGKSSAGLDPNVQRPSSLFAVTSPLEQQQLVQWTEDLIFGYALGCDLTRRDLQNEAKKLSRPWDASKGFDYSAPISSIVPKEELYSVNHLDPSNLNNTNNNNTFENFLTSEIQLWVNEELKQSSALNQMIWSIPEIIYYLTSYFTLEPGDLIMTGTPAGVGPLKVGDQVRIQCGAILPQCTFEMVSVIPATVSQ